MAPLYSAEEVWNFIQKDLQTQIPVITYNYWFTNVKPFYAGRREYGLVVRSKLISEYVTPYTEVIEEALRSATHTHYTLKIVIREDGQVPPVYDRALPKETSEDNGNHPPRARLNPEYTFDTFIVGPNNNFAHAASEAVSTMERAQNYNPLFLYGESGLGKTHLLHAIGNTVEQNSPETRVVYVNIEDFVNQFILCIRNNEYAGFREYYRNADILLIDDIQFIEGKERIQMEFFYTFNAVYESGNNVVITCDKPPQNLATLEQRLRTRFMSGLIVDIGPPDYETRLAILMKLAETYQTDLPVEVINYIANYITSNVRELEGAFKSVMALQDIGTEVTLEKAKHVLRNIIHPGARRVLTCDLIMEVVANYFGLTVDDLKSRKRSEDIVFPRHIAMFICRENLNRTLEEIGDAFGGKNHATVKSACDKMTKRIDEDDRELIETLEQIEARLQ